MENFKLVQVTPVELANLISETIKTEIQELSKHLKGSQSSKENKEFLDRKETAELFGVSLVCIHDWQNSGILKRYKMGRRNFYKYSELLETLYNSNRSKK